MDPITMQAFADELEQIKTARDAFSYFTGGTGSRMEAPTPPRAPGIAPPMKGGGGAAVVGTVSRKKPAPPSGPLTPPNAPLTMTNASKMMH